MEINRRVCPICGNDNDCAHEQGLPDGACWCSHIAVPKELMARIPDNLKGKACICRNCILDFRSMHQI
jgi:hypothetical protein